jgi:hypothetical protein
VTPLAALEHVSAKAHAAFWNKNEAAPICHLMLCHDCTAAVLRALDRLFRPTIGSQPVTLQGSQLMGCTFGQGTVEQCGRHDAMGEDA